MKREERLRDKVVWITGASSGIGEALAVRLNALGVRLILSSNEPAQLKRVRARLSNKDTPVMLLALDLGRVSSLAAKAERALARFGHVDVLINNGGISQRALAVDTALSVDIKIVNTDFLGHVALTKAVLPSMLARKSGHIVVTSSIMGKIYTPLRSTYTAAKHALHGFFDSLRSEVYRDNIDVTIVCPTGVKTGISKGALTGSGARYGKTDPIIEEGLDPDECAERIIGAILKRKHEVIIGKGFIKFSAHIRRFFPRLYFRLIKRATVI
jgi:dehydrogenase/reductase SDR family protein 7B